MVRSLGALVLVAGCSDLISSDEEAELAYLGLDRAVERAVRLGIDGYNDASSANIPDQSEDGDVSGVMTVGGQVDQGNSDNKGLRLDVALDQYADLVDVDEDEDRDVSITYWTDEGHPDGLPYLQMRLRDVPDGTLEGSFEGTFGMEGDLEGELVLEVELEGDIQADPEDAEQVQRVPGTTTVQGTARSSRGGTYDIDITI